MSIPRSSVKRMFLFLSMGSLMFCVFIYVAFRSTSLRFFDWMGPTVFEHIIAPIRSVFLPSKPNLHEWFIFSCPDGLWVFSYVCFIIAIWHDEKQPYKKAWLYLIPLAAFSSELLQGASLFPGTFDKVDLMFYSMGWCAPLIIFQIIKRISPGDYGYK